MSSVNPSTAYIPASDAGAEGGFLEGLIEKSGVFHLSFLVVLGLMLFFYNLGSYPLFDVDEPRYAEAAREMIERGNWITPYFNYELRFDKPVFFYWAIAASYTLFGGVSEFAARFVSATAGFSIILMMYAFARMWVTPRHAFFSALILASCIQFIGLSRVSITDMTLCLFMTATTLCLFMVAHKSTKWWLVAGFFAALAALTKGPVGIVVPGAILVTYALLTGNFVRCLFNRWFALGLVVFTLVTLPWYILAYLENGQIFLDALYLHNIDRYSGVVSGHKQPFYFFPLVLLVGFMPWSIHLPAGLMHTLKALPAGLRQLRSQSEGESSEANRELQVMLFGLVWAVFIFVFFSIAKTKLLTYILPMFPGMALWMGWVWHEAMKDPKGGLYKQLMWGCALLFGVAAIAAVVFVVNMAAFLPTEAQAITASVDNYIAAGALLAGLGIAAMMMFKRRLGWAVTSQAVSMAVVVVVALNGIVPRVNNITQGDMLAFLDIAGESPLATYEIVRPSLTFYAKRKVPRVGKGDEDLFNALVAPVANLEGQVYVITKKRFIETLSERRSPKIDLEVVKTGNVYALVLLKSQQTL